MYVMFNNRSYHKILNHKGNKYHISKKMKYTVE